MLNENVSNYFNIINSFLKETNISQVCRTICKGACCDGCGYIKRNKDPECRNQLPCKFFICRDLYISIIEPSPILSNIQKRFFINVMVGDNCIATFSRQTKLFNVIHWWRKKLSNGILNKIKIPNELLNILSDNNIKSKIKERCDIILKEGNFDSLFKILNSLAKLKGVKI